MSKKSLTSGGGSGSRSLRVKPPLSKMGLRILQERYFYAVYTRNLPEISKCLDKGVSPNIRSQEYGVSPLHIVAERNDAVLGYVLMTCKNIDLDLETLHGYTALHLACNFNCKKFAVMLLQMGADANFRDRFFKTPLHICVERDNYGILYQLLKYKANVKVRDCFENSPLALSLVNFPNLLIARTLIKHDRGALDFEELQKLHLFFGSSRLLKNKPPLSKIGLRILQEHYFYAVYTRNLPEISKCLDKGVSPNIRSQEYGVSPLHILAERNDTVLGYMLMTCKDIDLNLGTVHGYTALHLACNFNCKKFAIMLLQAGADVNFRDRFLKTPLHICVERDNYGILYQLLKHKANVQVRNCFDDSPLALSLIDFPNLLIARTLLKHDSGAIDFEELRMLHIFFDCILHCLRIYEIDYVELLLDNGVDINRKDKISGGNCLHFVAITGFLELAIVLVERGALLNETDNQMRTPARVAWEHRNAIMADYLQKGYRPPNLFKALPIIKLFKMKVQERINTRKSESENSQS